MIHNCTLLRVDTPAEPTTGGSVPLTTGDDINVRCAIGDPNSATKWVIDGAALNVQASLWVEIAELPTAASDLVNGVFVTVQPDGQGVQTFRIEHQMPRSSGLAHVQCLLNAG